MRFFRFMSTSESFEAVVIGSGFGGTISALTLANYFQQNVPGAQVCVLERGQWWISYEIPFSLKDSRSPGQKPNMREYLDDNGEPYSFWSHPDNVEGVVKLLSMARMVHSGGLYDYHLLSNNVHAIVASGVGGGSLIYSNVTVRPDPSVYKNWPTETQNGLDNYFPVAEKFIATNQITTNAGLANQILERSKLFQQAAKSAQTKNNHITNSDFALNLSITDVSDKVFSNLTPDVIAKYQNPMQTNVCQRQARCNLGCIPGARHTMNKRLFQAILGGKPIVIKSMCEAYRIEYQENQQYPYQISFRKFNKETDSVQEGTILAKRLIVAAGTLGSNELLSKSAAQGLKLSPKLGEGFSTDGDLLGYMMFNNKKIDITRGPINTSHAMFKTANKEFSFSIEDTSISPMVADFFATLLEIISVGKKRRNLLQKLALIRRYPSLIYAILFGVSLSSFQKILTKFWHDPRVRKMLTQMAKSQNVDDPKTLTLAYSVLDNLFADEDIPYASAAERLQRFFVFSCMGIDNADGVLKLRENWSNLEKASDRSDKLILQWSAEKNKQVFSEIIAGMREIADEMEPNGGKNVVAPTWNESKPSDSSLILLHPLGGCRMGEDIESGVVNSFGEVFKPDLQNKAQTYPNFCIIDGSIIPTSVGVNTSLTIAAAAFRCLDNMVGKQYLPA